MATTEPMGEVHLQGNSAVITSDRQPYFSALLAIMRRIEERGVIPPGGVMVAHHGPDGAELAPAFVTEGLERMIDELGRVPIRLVVHHVDGCPCLSQWPAICTCPPHVTVEGL